ncbi:unnamed protein product, partial [Adineta steineri]
MNDPVSAPPPP